MAAERTVPLILIVEDDPASAKLIRWTLVQEGYNVIMSESGPDAHEKAIQYEPDLVIIDVMLKGIDGLTLTRQIRSTPSIMRVPILIVSAKADISDKVAGFEAGADDYLAKPFSPEELLLRVKALLARVYGTRMVEPDKQPEKEGRVICFFGPKGGVGKTTLLVNLAIALREQSGQSVVVMDADFYFGTVGVHLNIPPTVSIIDIIQSPTFTPETIESALITHKQSGVRVLLNPFFPEQAELVRPDHVQAIITYLTTAYDYVLIDCQSSYDERTLVALENAHDIMLVITPEVGTIKNASRFLELVDKLEMPLESVHLLLNRADSNVGVQPREIERSLGKPIAFQFGSGGRPVALSVNRGVPIVLDRPKHPFAQQIRRMAEKIITQTVEQATEGGGLRRLLWR